MLHARKTSLWRNHYEVSADESPLGNWQASTWRSGGTLELDGQRYQVRSNLWGGQYRMVAEDGTTVASADRVGRSTWTAQAGDQQYEFDRASRWRRATSWGRKEELYSEGRQVGSIERTSMWRSDTVADIPGLPLVVQVFVLVVFLNRWDRASSGAGVGGGGGG